MYFKQRRLLSKTASPIKQLNSLSFNFAFTLVFQNYLENPNIHCNSPLKTKNYYRTRKVLSTMCNLYNLLFICCLGSGKIQRKCTFTIEAKKEADGTVVVDVCYTHYGHKNEIQQTWMSKDKL